MNWQKYAWAFWEMRPDVCTLFLFAHLADGVLYSGTPPGALHLWHAFGSGQSSRW